MIFFLQAKEWKCQPDKFLTPENERHEILLGSMNMLIGSTASGIIACYIMNGGSAPLSISTISPKVAIVLHYELMYTLYSIRVRDYVSHTKRFCL